MSRSRYILYSIDMILLFIFNIFLLHNILLAGLFSISIVFGIYAFRSYDLQSISNITESIIRIFFGTGFGFLGILVFYPIIYKYIDNLAFAYNGLFAITLFPILHKAGYIYYRKKRAVKKYLVIGKKEEMGKLLMEIEKTSLNKLKFIDYIEPEEINKIQSSNYDALLITSSSYEKDKDNYVAFRNLHLRMEYLPNLCEKILRRIPIIVAENFSEYYKVYFENIEDDPTKRLMDIMTSIVALIFFFPLMILIALLILIENGTPVILKQKRMGKNRTQFLMYKFRSLKELDEDEDENDPNADIEHRVLLVGRVIRKFRLDETVQFVNVLIGNMSLVGTRPEMLQFHNNSEAQIPFYNYRLKTNPGITGWAQINYKHTSTLEDYRMKTEYDLYYVKNKNIFLDLKIMLKTIEAMLGMRGAR